ncbi:MAG: hypothetical protein EBZ48_11105, partial [Proteobacteria bacterium]|nr:hypothetical protein [Pseudomonadota bacterium]
FEPRRRFTEPELREVFSALEADLSERLGDSRRGAAALELMAAAAGRELAEAECALNEAPRSWALGEVVGRELGVEQARLARAREIGRSDPRAALRSVEESRQRLSLLRQVVDIALWLDAQEEDGRDLTPESLESMRHSGEQALLWLGNVEQQLHTLLGEISAREQREALKNFTALYRLRTRYAD